MLEPRSNRWIKVVDSTSHFPPRGTVYVPEQLLPDHFQGQPDSAAAWAVMDQPNWAELGIGARHRATSLSICPPEIVDVPCSSTDIEIARRLLLYDGVRHVGGVQGRDSLLRFRDGTIAGPVRLLAKAGVRDSYYCTESTLSDPISAWESIELCHLSCKGCSRDFVARDRLPDTGMYLDFASLEVALKGMQVRGGIGSSKPELDVDAKALARQLSTVLEAYPSTPMFTARRSRLERLLDRVDKASAAWESWEEYVAQHPKFEEAVKESTASLRDEIGKEVRKELFEKEADLITKIGELESKQADEEELFTIIQEEVEQKKQERDILKAEVDRLQGEPKHAEQQAATEEAVPCPRQDESVQQVSTTTAYVRWISKSSDRTETLESADQAISHLEKNLQLIGLLPASSETLAREIFVASLLGQAMFFRGSYSDSLADLVATSLSGSMWWRLSVPIGRLDRIELPRCEKDVPVGAIVLEGVNRSCFDAYGATVRRILQERTLGLGVDGEVGPIVIGTLLDGPSCLPPSSSLIACGCLCDTDLLSWKALRGASLPVPGCCSLQAWKLEGKRFPMRMPEIRGRRPGSAQWRRNVVSAGGMLSAANERQALASVVCGWIAPYLGSLNISSLPDELAEGLHEVLSEEKVVGHLLANGIEVPS